MQDFITGLQFLTRIRLWRETQWPPEQFGRSVKYFPLVGGVIGAVLAAVQCFGGFLPPHVLAAALLVGEIVLTGGLHCDGFMDTMDGIFSGRSRERMLEIMKDSRVGANGVMALASLLFIKWSLLLDMPSGVLPYALFAMPVAGRLAMVFGISLFPYARPEGIGKAFARFAGSNTLIIASLFGAVLLGWSGKTAFISGVTGILCGLLFARTAARQLGGLTGDVYGAVTEITEVGFLFSMLLITKWSFL